MEEISTFIAVYFSCDWGCPQLLKRRSSTAFPLTALQFCSFLHTSCVVMLITPGRFSWERAVCYRCSLITQVAESVRSKKLCRVKLEVLSLSEILLDLEMLALPVGAGKQG